MSAPPRSAKKVDDFTKLVIALFLTPAPFEIAIGIVKRESYDFRRLTIIVLTLLGLAFLLAVLRRRIWWYPQTIVGYYVAVIGLAMAAFGVIAAIWDDAIRGVTQWSRNIEIAVTALAPSLGVLLLVCGVYLVIERRRRARQELDTPLPERINMPRMLPLQQHTSAIWQSEDSSRQKGREALIKICQGFLNVDDLHYVAFYTLDGDCDFYVDLFDDDKLELLASGDSGERRANYARHGRHIRHLASKLSRRFADLRTGLLVRLVLDVEKGAIYYYELGNQGFVIGVTLDQRQVDPTDWKMSDMANALLRAFGQQEDDDFYRLCPSCHHSNRQPHQPHSAAGNVLPLQKPG